MEIVKANTKKQMVFNDDIWKEIMSYLKPKKRELFNMFDKRIQNWVWKLWWCNKQNVFKNVFYNLRMIVPLEAINYELSKRGKYERKIFKQDVDYKLAFDRVLMDLNVYFETLNGNSSIIGRVSMDNGFYKSYYGCWDRFLDGMRDVKDGKLLVQIEVAGEEYMKRAKIRDYKRKRSEKRSVKVICDCCGKQMTNASLGRHKKKYCKSK